jgi:hypothetical protein
MINLVMPALRATLDFTRYTGSLGKLQSFR